MNWKLYFLLLQKNINHTHKNNRKRNKDTQLKNSIRPDSDIPLFSDAIDKLRGKSKFYSDENAKFNVNR